MEKENQTDYKITLKVDRSELDQAAAKAEELVKTLEKAKSLLQDLAKVN